MDNNIYLGNINKNFEGSDTRLIIADPMYLNAGGLSPDAYKLLKGSPALGSAKAMKEVLFPMGGKGIFKNICGKAVLIILVTR